MSETDVDDALFMAAYLMGKLTAHDAAQRQAAAEMLRAEVWALGDLPYQTAVRTIATGLTCGAAAGGQR